MHPFKAVVDVCQYLLHNCPQAEACRDYLNDRLLPETQQQYGFGFFPSIQDFSLLQSHIDSETLKRLNLVFDVSSADSSGPAKRTVSFFQNHPLVMPYNDAYGTPIGMVGRSLLSDLEREELHIQKYKNTNFRKGENLFGLTIAKSHIIKHGMVYVVEGQFDVIKAHERGIFNIVAVGSSNLSDYQVTILARYTQNIFVLFDNDEAGEKGRRTALKKYGKLINVNAAYLPEYYKDIDEFLKTNAVDYLPLTIKNDLI